MGSMKGHPVSLSGEQNLCSPIGKSGHVFLEIFCHLVGILPVPEATEADAESPLCFKSLCQYGRGSGHGKGGGEASYLFRLSH